MRRLVDARGEMTAAADDLTHADAPSNAEHDVAVIVATWRWQARLLDNLRFAELHGGRSPRLHVDAQRQLDRLRHALENLIRNGYRIRP